MSKLLEKLAKTNSLIKESAILQDSVLFNDKDLVNTPVPVINAAFSGDIDGGFTPGLTILSGESKTFKTMLSLYCLKAHQDKYEDSVCLFYDTEYGVTPQYLKAFNIDASRIIHIPVKHVEELKFDLVEKLEKIERNDHVFILLDSLGNLASKKEVEDAIDQKSVADMSRAKAIRSLLRIITPDLNRKNLTCIMINHVYKETGLFPKDVIPGGSAVVYLANSVFIIGKAQEKDGTEVTGYKFTINIHKSRFVKEKSKFAFSVNMNTGINRWSGLVEMAMEAGFLDKPSAGWYQKVDKSTGELLDPKVRLKDTNNAEFWKSILDNEEFKQWVRDRYQYGSGIGNDDAASEFDYLDDEGE